MLSDITDGMMALADKGIIDPKRACIVGTSYGGYAALASVTIQRSLYRCAVSVSGVSDLPSLFRWEAEGHGYEASEETRYWRKLTGADKAGESAIKAISPEHFADQADAPILLIHGTDDTIVPIDQSEEMKSALENAGKPVTFIKLKNEGHHLSHQETRIAMVKASVEFVKRHNPPD